MNRLEIARVKSALESNKQAQKVWQEVLKADFAQPATLLLVKKAQTLSNRSIQRCARVPDVRIWLYASELLDSLNAYTSAPQHINCTALNIHETLIRGLSRKLEVHGGR